jgi:hypothetical protein
MILTEVQQLELRKELNYAVKYRETYDEVYDHVVSAIENMADDKVYDVATATKHIINEEFGGYDTLKAMEKDRVKLMNVAMRKKHFQHMLQFLNFPVVGFRWLKEKKACNKRKITSRVFFIGIVLI